MNRPFVEATEQIVVRALTTADTLGAQRLKELAGWNQTERDWQRLLELEPEGCFAACAGERLVATTTTTTYGAALAWIGMVLVDPAYRRRGIATLLMRRALAYLQARKARTVKLDATPAGRPVYQALGFTAEALIERWQGRAHVGPARSACVELQARMQPQAWALDRAAFGVERARLLATLFADACAAPLCVLAPDGQLRGYVLTRAGAAATYVGPLVATDEPAATMLLDGVLHQLAGREVYVDINTGFAGSTSSLAERGLVKQRDLVRMQSGQPSRAGLSSSIYAIAGPELG
jgi:ribosomal protein S18 acetylase RimI-like enzyme